MTAVASAGWLRHYRREWLARDLIGGLSAGAVVIPQAMAYATIANLPVEVGLYTCMVPMAVYALLGGSRSLSVSTTSTIAILTASTLLAADVAAEGSDPAKDLATLTLLVGIILLATRVLRISSVIDNISEATLVGIKVGVGLTVAVGQLPKVLGIPPDPDDEGFFGQVGHILTHLGDASLVTVGFSVATLVTLFVIQRLAPKVPGPLLAVIGGIVVVAVASLDEHGLALVGKVPSGLPTPVLPSTGHITPLLPGAFAIAIMVFLETVSVARTVRRKTEPTIDNDAELAAIGVASVAGAFFRSMPPAGGFSQTAINQRAGARTQLSELVTVVLALACALFLGGVLSDLPEATLGCLVVVAVIGLIQPAEFVRFWRLSRLEFWVATATAGVGLCFGLLPAVLVGVLCTLYLVLFELDRIGVAEWQPTVAGHDIEVASERTRPVPGLLVLRLGGPLYTANVRGVNRRLLAAVDAVRETRPLQVVAVDASAVGILTLTVVDEVGQLEKDLEDRGVALWVTSLAPRALETARNTDRWDRFEVGGRVHPTALAAVDAFRRSADEPRP